MSRNLSAVLSALASLLIVPQLAAVVTGTVINRDGAVVANAKVTAYKIESREQYTARLLSTDPARTPIASVGVNSNGTFSLDVKGEPIVEIAAEADGYAPVSVRAGQAEELGTVALAAAAPKRGRVTAGGKGVANATVVWSGAGTFVARTDKDGYYSVPDPEKWANSIVVAHPDFALFGTEPRPNANRSADAVLAAGVALSGRVLQADGSPAPGANVFVDGWVMTKTAGDGSFALPHVPRSWSEMWIVSGDQLAMITSAGLKPGAITARLTKAARVSGTVRDGKTQKAIARTTVGVARSAAPGRFNSMLTMVVAGNDGSFDIAVPPGSYELAGIAPGYRFDTPAVTVKGGQAAVKTLTGTALGTATGFVYDESRKPIPGAVVSADGPDRMGRMGRVSFFADDRRVTGPDGRFILRSVTPDADVNVQARKKGLPPGESASFRLAPGERKSGIAITIPQGIAITGKVTDRDGHALGGVSIVANESEADPRGGIVRRIVMFGGDAPREDVLTTSSDGTFTIRLKEGRYDLGFSRRGFAVKNVRAVEVKRGAEPLAVQMDPGADITGRVTRNGTGVDGVVVSAFSETNQAQSVTAPDGSFSLMDLSPGPVSLNLIKPDEFVRDNRRATAPAKDLLLELPPGGRIAGRVIEKESGKPVTDFSAGFSNSRSGGGLAIVAPPSMRSFHSEDGTFVLENVSPDTPMQLLVNAPGFAPFKQAGIRVEAGKSTDEITAALETGATLTGRVTSPEGSPLAGVAVSADGDVPPGMVRMPNMSGGVTSDANGEYTIESLAPGEATFSFGKSGYETLRKTVKLDARTNRLDVTLSKGVTLTGVVVTDSGAPVADARISVSQGMDGSRATTDGNGTFRIEGLSAGRYEVSAAKSGWVTAELKDVDVSTSGPLRMVLKSGGRISGHVSGLTAADLESASVIARSVDTSSAGAVNSSGEYVIEGVAAGTVTVSARVGSFNSMRMSSSKTVQIAEGGSAQVDLEFGDDTVIRGVVRRDGKPEANAMVAFRPRAANARTYQQVNTDANGAYEVRGLEDGEYLVFIASVTRMVSTTRQYTVRGSGTFDVDIKGATVTGMVVDAATGEGLNEATVTIAIPSDEGGVVSGRRAVTDASGRFTIDSVEPGNYRGRAERKDYGQQVIEFAVTESGASDVQFKLQKQEGLKVRVIDARDGRPLRGAIIATDAAGAVATTSFDGGDSDGVISLGLAPGRYRLRVGSIGDSYAQRFLTVNVPSPRITIGLTPGGTLQTMSAASDPIACRVVNAEGDDVLGVFGQEIVVRPGEGRFENLAPGSYTLVLLDAAKNPVKSIPFNIAEGQTTRVEVK